MQSFEFRDFCSSSLAKTNKFSNCEFAALLRFLYQVVLFLLIKIKSAKLVLAIG